jgi:AcrR family transcriptional regulator
MNTEQIILEAAEKLFLEKGYAGTRTTEIAKAAGVNHAMLHYYFRTKEKLFDQIFEKKAALLLGYFVTAFNRECPFFEKLKIGIELHFDFLSQTPELPLFIIREVVLDKEKKNLILQKVFPIGKKALWGMARVIRAELNKGTIRPIRATDLLLNIASLNVFSFIALQVLFDINPDEKNEDVKKFLESRKKNIVDTIINSIKL